MNAFLFAVSMAWALGACASHTPSTAEQDGGPILPRIKAPAMTGQPVSSEQGADASELVRGDSSEVPQHLLHAEVVEADTIRVGVLRAITLEAVELRVPSVTRVSYFPVAKDQGMVKLEGHLIAAEQLEAHHVRARLVVADKVIAHRVTKLRGAAPWPRGEDQAEVVNQCVHLTAATNQRQARCSLVPQP